MYPAVVAAPAPLPPFFAPPVAAPRPASFVPPVQPIVPGPINNGGWPPVAAYQPLPPREWSEEDLETLTEVEMDRLFHILRRDHENQRQ